jgi:hypothetical protein
LEKELTSPEGIVTLIKRWMKERPPGRRSTSNTYKVESSFSKISAKKIWREG